MQFSWRIRFRTWKIYDFCPFSSPSFSILLNHTLLWKFSWTCSLPFCFHSYYLSSGHCCLILGSSSNLPVLLPVSSCSVSHKCNWSHFPLIKTWIINPMPIITTSYTPCPLKNSNLVLRVLPVSSQCGKTVSAPR